jgi:hypothetical protein
MENYFMSKEDLNYFLESIDGLENGFYADRPPIKDYRYFGVDEGWYGIIKELIEDLIKLGWNKQVCQVKEKFGGLRFYINDGSNEIHDRIIDAEKKSYEVCEKCGNSGKLRNDIGWYLTLCEDHYKETKEK